MCYNSAMDDLKIYKKAQKHVKASLILFFIMLLAMIVGTWFLLHISLFQVSSSSFNTKLLLTSLCQVLVFGSLYYLLFKGIKSARIFYWVAVLGNICLLYFPIVSYFENPSGIYTWLAWVACLIIEDVLLYNTGMYFYQNHSCKIYYDHVIEIDEDDAHWYEETMEVPVVENKVKPERESGYAKMSSQESYISENKTQPEQKSESSYDSYAYQTPPIPSTPSANTAPKKKMSLRTKLQRLSVKLGICVYGEMILFPIIVSLFSDYFASTDMKSVFATRDIFILCILSSFIWTIAIFFLYYASSQSRKIILLCWAGEIAVNVWYLPKLYNYFISSTPAYPTQVFLFFIILDVIRYILIILVLSPVFQKNPE